MHYVSLSGCNFLDLKSSFNANKVRTVHFSISILVLLFFFNILDIVSISLTLTIITFHGTFLKLSVFFTALYRV